MFFNAKSPQAGQRIHSPTSRSSSAVAHASSPPSGALRVSGGLLEFLRDADHQTFGEALDEAASTVTSYLDKDYRKGTPSIFARVLECRFES